jgi:hypothetical protein
VLLSATLAYLQDNPVVILLKLPKHAVLKSLLGHVSSAMPAHCPSCTLSKQNCLVQLKQGFWSFKKSSNTVEFEPQKHLQNVFISKAFATLKGPNNKSDLSFMCKKKKRKRKEKKSKVPDFSP